MSITYSIRETSVPSLEEPDLSSIIAELQSFSLEHQELDDTIVALQTDYEENYTKKSVTRIAEYYDIQVKKSNKIEIITMVVAFEVDPNNFDLVQKRRKIWDAIREIKNDSKMRKYLLGDVI
jgi:hypothetical protein